MADTELNSLRFPGLSDRYTIPQIDTTLSVSGAAADAKTTGDEIDELRTDLETLEQEGYPMASIQDAVDAWAEENQYEIVNAYVTPEMYGAKGDGVTDDTTAIQAAIDSGKPVCFSGSTYKITQTINIGAGGFLQGGYSVITGAANPMFLVQTYTSSQLHTSVPVTFSNFRLIGNGSNTLISVTKALKSTISNIEMRDFSVGVVFNAGYENLFQNLRFIGSSGSTAVQIISGGDSTFEHLYGMDCPIAIRDGSSGHNVFNDIHFWIKTQALYPGSIMIYDEAPGGPTGIFNEVYFDTYQKCYYKTGLAGAIFNNPRYLSNEDVATADDSTLFYIDNAEFTSDYSSRVRFNNLITSLANTTRCVFACNNTTIPVYLTFMPANATQRDRLILCNLVKDIDERQLARAECISLNSGFTITNGFAWKKDRRVYGDYVIQCSSALAAGSQTSIGAFLLPPFSAVNTFCITDTTEWGSSNIAYLYYSNSSIVVKPTTSGQTFIKLHFDYTMAL